MNDVCFLVNMLSLEKLDEFALDEYQGNLRVATTIGASRNFFGFGFNSADSVSDVTVLDANLKELGAVQDLGKSEQIYSVRFIQDKGYVVTFRQTDPFYVLDLTNPNSPRLRGELKIPGFSSYLHPISKDEILGIGREGSIHGIEEYVEMKYMLMGGLAR